MPCPRRWRSRDKLGALVRQGKTLADFLFKHQHQHQQHQALASSQSSTSSSNSTQHCGPMPELPEVEHAASIARAVAVGRTITSVSVLHPAQRRGLPAREARSLVGDRVISVERRGKAQRFRLASGRELRVHFRMTGDWLLPAPGPLPRSARAVLEFDDGGLLVLDDPRALSVISLCATDETEEDGLGPDALDPAMSAEAPRRRAGLTPDPDQGGAARPVDRGRHRQHLRVGVPLARPDRSADAGQPPDEGTPWPARAGHSRHDEAAP